MIEDKVCRNGSSSTECSENDPLLNWGDDISDALLTSHVATRERGRVEIDKSYSNRHSIDFTIPKLLWNQPGSCIQLDGINKSKTGLTRNISLHYERDEENNISINTSFRMEST